MGCGKGGIVQDTNGDLELIRFEIPWLCNYLGVHDITSERGVPTLTFLSTG